MKTLSIIISNLEIGGAQQLITNLSPYLSRHFNLQVIVFKKTGSEFEKNIENLGIKIISLNIGSYSPLAILKLRKIIKKTDLVHINLFPANYYSVLANIGINKPLVFTEHSTHNRRRNYKILKPVERFIYKRFKKIISISEATKTNLNKWLNSESIKKRNIVIENGIDIDKFNSVAGRPSKEIFGRDGIPVLMISRFTESKDHETVVKALKEIQDPRVFGVFVGDGTTQQNIIDLVKSLGLEDRVIFLGNRTDIPEIIKSAKIGIQSSHWEGFGLTVIEMMAGGLPVLASDVIGLGTVVKDAGILFEQGNYKILAQNIMEILNNPEKYSSLRSNGYQRVKRYSIKKTAENYKNILENLKI